MDWVLEKGRRTNWERTAYTGSIGEIHLPYSHVLYKPKKIKQRLGCRKERTKETLMQGRDSTWVCTVRKEPRRGTNTGKGKRSREKICYMARA